MPDIDKCVRNTKEIYYTQRTYIPIMSVVSSRVNSVSSVLKGIKSQVGHDNRVYFKLPRNIKVILCNYEAGKGRKEYEELISLLRNNAIKDNDLMEFLNEARRCISLLNSTHKLLVEILLRIRWMDRSPEVVSAYKLFLEDLICTQIHCTKTVTDRLVELFQPMDDNDMERQVGKLKDKDIERLNHVHDVLRKILKVLPMSGKLLLQSLISQFPYIIHGTYTHEVYIYALLQILDYAPQLRSDVLSLILNRLTILDVNIPREEASDDEEDDVMDDSGSYDGAASVDDSTAMNNMDEMKVVHQTAYTLDACMELFFKYMHGFCYPNNVLHTESLKTLYYDVLRIFETVILPTHASRNVQYIAFYICSFKTAVTEAFLDWLWCKVIDPNVAPVIRRSAVCYISSLLVTASYVTPGLVKTFVSRLTKWIHNYIAMRESSEYIDDDAMTHTVFYTVCRAFFYLFVMRHEQLVTSKNNILFLQELDIPKIIACRLNPLRVCDSKIVHNFADITRTYQLAYCYAIIENNTRSRLPVLGEEIHSSILISDLFPFESYTLQYSGNRILPLFHDNVVCTNGRTIKKKSVIQNISKHMHE